MMVHQQTILDRKLIFRWYQKEAIKALMDFVLSGVKGNPIVTAPTGSGKTAILCGFTNEYLTNNVTNNILILSHVEEILQQDYNALSSYFEGFEVGLYSAGLGSKSIKKITVAGIQSVFRSPHLFKNFHCAIIDECHLVTIKEDGMYRKFLASIGAICVGLTATPFKLGHGKIYQGDNVLFTDLVYDICSRQNYNRLVAEGYLSKLITKRTDLVMDPSENVKLVGGDYNSKHLSKEFDREEITEAAVSEIMRHGVDYHKWLLFSIDIDHAEHISDFLNTNGIRTCCVHSKMGGDRKKIIKEYKNGEYRAAVNVDIMTTGLDIPTIDLIGQLRNTKSHVVHIQSMGRGSRVVYADGYDLDTIEGRLDAIDASPKKHCLVLDFTTNTKDLGPINDPIIKEKKDKKESGDPITKTCPGCDTIHHPSIRICDVCFHKFEFKVHLKTRASETKIVADDEKEFVHHVEWIKVDKIRYSLHKGRGEKPDSMLVTYNCGINIVKEWICYDHKGYACHKAKNWVNQRMDYKPKNVPDLIEFSSKLKKPLKIQVDFSGKFDRILSYEF